MFARGSGTCNFSGMERLGSADKEIIALTSIGKGPANFTDNGVDVLREQAEKVGVIGEFIKESMVYHDLFQKKAKSPSDNRRMFLIRTGVHMTLKRLQLACLILGAFWFNSLTYAQDWNFGNGWSLIDTRAYTPEGDGKEPVNICYFSDVATIFATGEEISCPNGTIFVVDLYNQEIFYAKWVRSWQWGNFTTESRSLALGLNNGLYKSGYKRFEILRDEQIKRRAAAHAAGEVAAAEKARQDYLSAYEAAKSLPLINEFETRYAGNDPDGLIPKLASLKSQLEHQDYFDSLAQADTADKLAAFIAKYENNDPSGIVPAAKKRLSQLQKQEQAEQERRNREMIAEQERRNLEIIAAQKHRELENLASRIVWCNHQTLSAHQTIDREREIGQVSGYENKLLLRQAGEIIVGCRDSVGRDYDAYRKKGGMKNLGELK